jgi:hypothetical protein
MNNHMLLMRLHDEELGADEREALLAELGEDDRAVLEGLDELGDALRAHAERAAPGADDIADRVMAKLDQPVPLARARRAKSTPILVAGLALAAAAAFLLWQKAAPAPSPPESRSAALVPSTPAIPTVTTATSQPAVPAEDETVPAVAIEAVDFGNQAGSIFVVGEESTPVVWLVDEPPGTKMEKL